MMPDGAPGQGTQDRMVAREVTRDTPHGRALQAARGIRARGSEQRCRKTGRNNIALHAKLLLTTFGLDRVGRTFP